ncbi:hypothetical protein CMQ_620 [Grosmannia clavigera kw1407]|uniref:Uncharacterized protein n=1 Tax=Grosmannia clavigera (strain kw1407 / UAMH 11150) TaxID=655863 RepID=F0XC82_GROCL|nr:uncharacterized protein CMQ_620 [Grosmannia clavigera kw1407]EFX03692.1 hypothetical protein CMQ_620 [Grosmannia clavigera kw1407]
MGGRRRPARVADRCHRTLQHHICRPHPAAGKIGSILAVLIVYGVDVEYDSATKQGLLFLLFSSFMSFGALYSWAYLPDVQRRNVVPNHSTGEAARGHLENKNLEDLGEGRAKAKQEGEIITIRGKWSESRRWYDQRRLHSTGAA